jgi:hypothetical protein
MQSRNGWKREALLSLRERQEGRGEDHHRKGSETMIPMTMSLMTSSRLKCPAIARQMATSIARTQTKKRKRLSRQMVSAAIRTYNQARSSDSLITFAFTFLEVEKERRRPRLLLR